MVGWRTGALYYLDECRDEYDPHWFCGSKVEMVSWFSFSAPPRNISILELSCVPVHNQLTRGASMLRRSCAAPYFTRTSS